MDSDLHMTFSVTEKYKCTNMFMSHNHFMHIFTCNSFESYIDQILSKIKVPHILFQKPSLIQYISWKYENPLRKQESLSCMHSRLIPPLFFHCALCSWIHFCFFALGPSVYYWSPSHGFRIWGLSGSSEAWPFWRGLWKFWSLTQDSLDFRVAKRFGISRSTVVFSPRKINYRI